MEEEQLKVTWICASETVLQVTNVDSEANRIWSGTHIDPINLVFNLITNNLYGWWHNGDDRWANFYPNSFCMSFVVAFSQM